jgi:transcription termination factor Rho
MGIAGTGRMRKSQLITAIQEKQGGGSAAPARGAKATATGTASAATGTASEVSAPRAAAAGADAARSAEQEPRTETGTRSTRAARSGTRSGRSGGTQQLSFDASSAGDGAAQAGSSAPAQTQPAQSGQAAQPAAADANGDGSRGDGQQNADAPRGERRRRNNSRDGQPTRSRDGNGRDGSSRETSSRDTSRETNGRDSSSRDTNGRETNGRDGSSRDTSRETNGRDSSSSRDTNGRDNNRSGGSRDAGRDRDGGRDRDRQPVAASGGDQGYDDDDDGTGRRRSRDRFRNRNRRRERGQGGGGEPDPTISEDDVLIPIAGILDVLDNYAFVRTTGYLPGSNDVYVSLSQVRRYGLRKGDVIEGAVRQPRDGERREKFNALVRLDKINGLDPEASKDRLEFSKLVPLYPQDRLRLETEPNIMTTRIMDLICPIGKGQRGLIVSPPKAGKTMILQAIANAITKNNPECHLMVVLVDERPEEVTDMQRTVKGEVIHSTFDHPADDHTTVWATTWWCCSTRSPGSAAPTTRRPRPAGASCPVVSTRPRCTRPSGSSVRPATSRTVAR